MGFSVTDFLRDVGKGIVGNVVPGGNLAVAAGSSAVRLLTGGGGTPTFEPVVPQQPSDIYGFPDFIERQIFPGNFPAAPASSAGGCPQIPVTVSPGVRQVAVAPPGYVIVNCNGVKTAMLKPVARSLGKWKPRRKPPIKASDWRCLMKADATIRKLKNVTKRAGVIQRARGKR
tara:strand:- start:26 stop:544 length:519 start_codon:yes stop_codon:yes gene_type:complete